MHSWPLPPPVYPVASKAGPRSTPKLHTCFKWNPHPAAGYHPSPKSVVVLAPTPPFRQNWASGCSPSSSPLFQTLLLPHWDQMVAGCRDAVIYIWVATQPQAPDDLNRQFHVAVKPRRGESWPLQDPVFQGWSNNPSAPASEICWTRWTASTATLLANT